MYDSGPKAARSFVHKSHRKAALRGRWQHCVRRFALGEHRRLWQDGESAVVALGGLTRNDTHYPNYRCPI